MDWINDAGYITTKYEYNSDGSKTRIWICPYFSKWTGVKNRVNRNSTKNITVCEGWLYFSNFKEWMLDKDWEGKELDKDLGSYLQGGKDRVYSPETCHFIPKYLNTFLAAIMVYLDGDRTQGANYQEDRDSWLCQVRVDGKKRFIGRFSLQCQANKAWHEYKSKLFLEEIHKHKDEVYCDILKELYRRFITDDR